MQQMGALNAAAAEAMRAVGVHACTDVTGYGLLGHGHEMAAGAGVDLRFSAAALPLLSGAHELMRKGFASGGAARTKAHLGARLVVADGVDPVVADIAADSETSGGLLLAVAPDRAGQLEDALRERGLPAGCVGEVTAAEGESRVHLLP